MPDMPGEQDLGGADALARARADGIVHFFVAVGAHAAVGHDSTVGDCVHLAAGARMGGHTKIGDYSLPGMGAVVLPGLTIGRNVSVGANAVVHRDLADRSVAAGHPARVVRRNEGPGPG